MATIRITNLRLRTIIGIYDWERKDKQDVIINVTMEIETPKAVKSDRIKDTVDYKKITKKIIQAVEASKYYLIEKLAGKILEIVMKESRINKATVRVDKPFALRFADSVSFELTQSRDA